MLVNNNAKDTDIIKAPIFHALLVVLLQFLPTHRDSPISHKTPKDEV